MIGVKFFSHIGNKWKFSTYLLAVVILLVTGIYIYRYEPFRSGFEISDELGGNIFPVTTFVNGNNRCESHPSG